MFKRFMLLALFLFPMILCAAGGITRVGDSAFNLRDPGFYQVSFHATIVEAGQLQISLNGEPLERSTVGRATGNTQIVGCNIIETNTENTVLRIINPDTNTPITLAQGTAENPLSAHVVILRLK